MKRLAWVVMLLSYVSPLFSQQRTLVMTLDDVIETARVQSQEALIAKHSFLSSYWSYRSYKAHCCHRSISIPRLGNITERFLRLRGELEHNGCG